MFDYSIFTTEEECQWRWKFPWVIIQLYSRIHATPAPRSYNLQQRDQVVISVFVFFPDEWVLNKDEVVHFLKYRYLKVLILSYLTECVVTHAFGPSFRFAHLRLLGMHWWGSRCTLDTTYVRQIDMETIQMGKEQKCHFDIIFKSCWTPFKREGSRGVVQHCYLFHFLRRPWALLIHPRQRHIKYLDIIT